MKECNGLSRRSFVHVSLLRCQICIIYSGGRARDDAILERSIVIHEVLRLKRLRETRRILKLLDRESFQFFDFNMPVFRKRDHHRGDAFTAFVVCFVYA